MQADARFGGGHQFPETGSGGGVARMLDGGEPLPVIEIGMETDHRELITQLERAIHIAKGSVGVGMAMAGHGAAHEVEVKAQGSGAGAQIGAGTVQEGLTNGGEDAL